VLVNEEDQTQFAFGRSRQMTERSGMSLLHLRMNSKKDRQVRYYPISLTAH